MMPRLPIIARAGAAMLMLAVAACSHDPKARPYVSAAAPGTPASEIDAILLLLDHGDTAHAGKRIAAALKQDPANPSVLVLRDSIRLDAKELLGPSSFPYTTRPGDTMQGLAQRFLGNRLKAYQLARYNGIDKPDTLVSGQSLRIPGQPPRVDAPKRAEPRPAPMASPPAKTRPAPPKLAPAKAPLANPAAARQARTAGLAALNAGNLPRAVGLLRRAAMLDPANPAIARDLARAERIASTVKARK